MKNQSKYSNTLTKAFLYKEYIKNKKSIYQIADEIGCCGLTILRYLIKYRIYIRTHSESLKGKYVGEMACNYNPERHKQHFCKDCLKKGIKTEISMDSALYGGGRCPYCAHKKIALKLWQDPEYRDKQRKAWFEAMKLSPNKPESILIKLLNKILTNQYIFVGNGKLIVDGFCPDFVNKDNNKIIEFYGDYWHGNEDVKKEDTGRLHAYKRNGYKTLIIWEHELKDLDKVKNRILKFNKLI